MPVVPAPTEAPLNLHSTGIAFAVSIAASSLVCWAQGRLSGGCSSVVRTQAAPPALQAATPEDPCRSCKVTLAGESGRCVTCFLMGVNPIYAVLRARTPPPRACNTAPPPPLPSAWLCLRVHRALAG